jgi:hypothetical protein
MSLYTVFLALAQHRTVCYSNSVHNLSNNQHDMEHYKTKSVERPSKLRDTFFNPSASHPFSDKVLSVVPLETRFFSAKINQPCPSFGTTQILNREAAFSEFCCLHCLHIDGRDGSGMGGPLELLF